MCNANNYDHYNYYDVTVAHTADNVVVLLSSTIDQAASDEAWGFNNFYIEALDANGDCAVATTADASCDLVNDFSNDVWDTNDVNDWTFVASDGSNPYTCLDRSLVGLFG